MTCYIGGNIVSHPNHAHLLQMLEEERSVFVIFILNILATHLLREEEFTSLKEHRKGLSSALGAMKSGAPSARGTGSRSLPRACHVTGISFLGNARCWAAVNPESGTSTDHRLTGDSHGITRGFYWLRRSHWARPRWVFLATSGQ